MADVSVVVNASPLILLARVGRLDLLRALGDDVSVPATVLREIEAGEHHDGAAFAVKAAGFIRVVNDIDSDPRVVAWHIDVGETQVISLALSLPGSVAVLDDLAARRCAQGLSVRLVGTAGLVALCRARGLIPSAGALIAALRAKGLYLSARTEHELLALVGEKP